MRRAFIAAAIAGVVGASAIAAPAGLGGQTAQAATTAGSSCVVSDASLTWGFKESFRSYISGSIAKGKWEVANGATYTTPSFGWPNGEGDLVSGAGTLHFTGSIRFTGHEGVLDTTVANPALEFRPDGTAVLLLDVTGETQEGVAVATKAVPFADVALSKQPALSTGGIVTISGAATTLTTTGAAAFGSYQAGTALDPIDAILDVACPTPAPTPAATTPPSATADAAAGGRPAAAVGATTSAGPTAGLLSGGIALAAIIVAGAAYLVVRRRRAGRSGDTPASPSDNGTTPGGTA